MTTTNNSGFVIYQDLYIFIDVIKCIYVIIIIIIDYMKKEFNPDVVERAFILTFSHFSLYSIKHFHITVIRY